MGRHITLRSKYMEKIAGGKFTTIRLGIVRPKFSEVYVHSGGLVVAKARIMDVVYKRVRDLTDEDAVKDGFSSREELIGELRKIYGRVRESDWVTVLVLKVVEWINARDDGSGSTINLAEVAKLALNHGFVVDKEEELVMRAIAEEGSIRRATVRLYGTVDGRGFVRRVARRVIKRLVEAGLLKEHEVYLLGTD